MVFAVLVTLGNLTSPKFVTLAVLPFYTCEISVGAMVYPLTFLVMDLIAECYGRYYARLCVHGMMALNLVTALMLRLMDGLPAAAWSPVDSHSFHHVFGFCSAGLIGSILAYYIAQMVDIMLYLWIRCLTKGRYLWLRALGSTSCSLLVDTSVVVAYMAWAGALPEAQLLRLTLDSYGFKLGVAWGSYPLFFASVWLIRRAQTKAAAAVVQRSTEV